MVQYISYTSWSRPSRWHPGLSDVQGRPRRSAFEQLLTLPAAASDVMAVGMQEGMRLEGKKVSRRLVPGSCRIAPCTDACSGRLLVGGKVMIIVVGRSARSISWRTGRAVR